MEVLGQINRGGFGRVERVARPDGTILARKVFSPAPELGEDIDRAKLRKRFIREVRVQSSLDSGFFLPVYESDLTGEEPWFAMPLASKSYTEQIRDDRRNGHITDTALADILNGLEALHALGFVHRDLKPQNILCHDGKWKLADLGLVLPPSGMTTRLTSQGSTWGTEEYAAPEQARNFGAVGASADIYSFGCILHDLVVGMHRVPYQKHTGPGALGTVIEKCTEFNPAKRFKSISGLRGALFSILAQPVDLAPSREATAWASELETALFWDVAKLEEFARFLNGEGTARDMWPVFAAIDEEAIEELSKLNPELWEVVGGAYCEWAHGGFDFSYCDVVAVRLRRIFEFTASLSLKAAAALAMAELAASHNRWFVMHELFGLCGHSLDATVAARIAIEIRAEEAQDNFKKCARVIRNDVSNYHPIIGIVLED